MQLQRGGADRVPGAAAAPERDAAEATLPAPRLHRRSRLPALPHAGFNIFRHDFCLLPKIADFAFKVSSMVSYRQLLLTRPFLGWNVACANVFICQAIEGQSGLP